MESEFLTPKHDFRSTQVCRNTHLRSAKKPDDLQCPSPTDFQMNVRVSTQESHVVWFGHGHRAERTRDWDGDKRIQAVLIFVHISYRVIYSNLPIQTLTPNVWDPNSRIDPIYMYIYMIIYIYIIYIHHQDWWGKAFSTWRKG